MSDRPGGYVGPAGVDLVAGEWGGGGGAADERELPPSQGLRCGKSVPSEGPYFLLRWGVGDLMSRGFPRWVLNAGRFLF
jgi:hypothetical protein